MMAFLIGITLLTISPAYADHDRAYPGAAVIKIERDKQEVEVKLNNGMELTFDRSHNLIGIDD